MTEFALGSAVAFAALPAATQARFTTRYDNAHKALTFIETVDNPMVDDYRLVYIESGVVESNEAISIHNHTPAGIRSIELTALDSSYEANFSVTSDDWKSGTDIISDNNVAWIMHDFKIVSDTPNATQITVGFGVYNNTCTLDVYNMEFRATNAGKEGIGLQITTRFNAIARVYNCQFYNFNIGLRCRRVTTLYPGEYIVEKCSFYDCDTGMDTQFTIAAHYNKTTYRSTVICNDTGTTDWGSVSANADYFNCADSDGSLNVGTNTQNNIVPANEFLSRTQADATFLRLGSIGTWDITGEGEPNSGRVKLSVQFRGEPIIDYTGGEQLARNGIAPTLTTVDKDGIEVGQYGWYSIGAYEATIDDMVF